MKIIQKSVCKPFFKDAFLNAFLNLSAIHIEIGKKTHCRLVKHIIKILEDYYE